MHILCGGVDCSAWAVLTHGTLHFTALHCVIQDCAVWCSVLYYTGARPPCTHCTGARPHCTHHSGARPHCTHHSGARPHCTQHTGIRLQCTHHTGARPHCTHCTVLACTVLLCCPIVSRPAQCRVLQLCGVTVGSAVCRVQWGVPGTARTAQCSLVYTAGQDRRALHTQRAWHVFTSQQRTAQHGVPSLLLSLSCLSL